ncbi:MAG: hypothetical protein IKU29_00510 [Parabacteroides sp.]|nr:hypothetical protein [Parabacteroides sp.]
MIEGSSWKIKYIDPKNGDEYLYTLYRRSDNWNSYYFSKYKLVNGRLHRNDDDEFTIVTENCDDIEKITEAPKHYFDYMFKSQTSRLYNVGFEVYKPDEGDTNIRINYNRSSKVYSDDIDNIIDDYKSMNFEDDIILYEKEEKILSSDTLLSNPSKKYWVRILIWVEYGKSLDDMKDDIISFINKNLDNDNDSE